PKKTPLVRHSSIEAAAWTRRYDNILRSWSSDWEFSTPELWKRKMPGSATSSKVNYALLSQRSLSTGRLLKWKAGSEKSKTLALCRPRSSPRTSRRVSRMAIMKMPRMVADAAAQAGIGLETLIDN